MITELLTSIAYIIAHLIHITLIAVKFLLTFIVSAAMMMTLNISLAIIAVLTIAFLTQRYNTEIQDTADKTAQFIQRHGNIFNPISNTCQYLLDVLKQRSIMAYQYAAPILAQGLRVVGQVVLNTSIRLARSIYHFIQPKLHAAYHSQTSQDISDIVTELEIKPFMLHLALIAMATHIYFGPALVLPAAVCFSAYYLKCTYDKFFTPDEAEVELLDGPVAPVAAENIPQVRMEFDQVPELNAPVNDIGLEFGNDLDQDLVAQF